MRSRWRRRFRDSLRGGGAQAHRWTATTAAVGRSRRDEIMAQADRNRARMRERDPDRRRALLADLQAIAADPATTARTSAAHLDDRWPAPSGGRRVTPYGM